MVQRVPRLKSAQDEEHSGLNAFTTGNPFWVKPLGISIGALKGFKSGHIGLFRRY